MRDVNKLDGVYFTHVRNENKEIVGTVAFRENEDGTVNRGIAVVGYGDQANKEVGRKAAAGRLLKAEAEKGEHRRAMKITKPACDRFLECFRQQFGEPDDETLLNSYRFKSAYHVTPTQLETHVLEATSGEVA